MLWIVVGLQKEAQREKTLTVGDVSKQSGPGFVCEYTLTSQFFITWLDL